MKRTLVLIFAILAVNLEAQNFGRNKVAYKDFDFNVLKTEHFLIHSYIKDSLLLQDAARMSERWYYRFRNFLHHDFAGRKPMILYANHADFQQTNITPGFVD